ncbi:N-acetyl-gamma-glutamyl-phosphate reductase [Sporosarcina sp. P37]|uniref:N-acetyl-gamma-glutamyl-phosphate reductase n=1 Tax=unclassified Sporosarcina TaxID=2647733 RepID=UPI0009C256C9|nr:MULTISPECIES: N-acetyl-gamma-glutamyl-phosphate reductase [unclassified Sporosarcina]ARD47365.1 N-acetyl-gamma-glutamyl-phosphate reductase [Sporosarcina sp. P33]ARK23932.1 N-acetyl-gamma-glutamyl-phosphate reductase [Sporosarcina sp. P37]
MKVGIIGASGYGGLELIRLLQNHPEIEQIDLFTSSEEGTIFSEKYPHLVSVHDQPMQAIEPEYISGLDTVFFSTPAGVTTALLPPLVGTGPKLIDLSGDFRLKDPAVFEQWYQKDAPAREFLERSVYGLPEWNKSEIAEAEFIANPGCYPTAVLLSLLPLLKNKLIDGSQLIIDAKSGISGAGNKPSQATHFSETNENFSIYKIHQHQHIPEIEQAMNLFADQPEPVTFTTHLVPMTRGIMATSYAKVNGQVTEEQLVNCLQETYKDSPFVRVLTGIQKIGTKQVYGSNYCDIHVKVDPRTNQATVIAVIDNVVKGAAGQAIQNMNIQYGLDETTGIMNIPLWI